MPITPTTLADLDAEVVAERELLLKELLSGFDSSLDLSPSSVLYALLIRPAAQLHALIESDVDRVSTASSLKLAVASPDEVDSEAVDNLLGNYFITRNTESLASGQVRVELDQLKYTALPDSLVLSAGDIQFRPTRGFAGVTSSANVISSDQRLIQRLGDSDRYYFVIDVVALEPGETGNVRQGTTFTASTPAASQIVNLVAVADFDGGAAEETDAELLARAPTGITSASLGSRDGVRALLAAEFPSVIDSSVIGGGDVEMSRDSHNAMGISAGGKVDVYVRTRDAALTTQVTKSATLTDAGTWVANFTRDEVPGAYSVESVRYSEAAADEPDAELVAVTRGVDSTDVSGLDFTPAMVDAEHVFTRYQTMAVEFTCTVTGAVAGDEADFDFNVLYMPELSEINDYCLARDVRPPAGDYLVRAAVPCLVTVNVVVVADPDDQEVDEAGIVAAVVAEVNSHRFADGRLPIDAIYAAVRSKLAGRAYVKGALDVRGRVILPYESIEPNESAYDRSGNYYMTAGSAGLVAPYLPSFGVSRRTVSFMTYASLVSVTVESSDHPVI